MLYTYNLTLADTIPYMNSSDYKDRFIGEYWQTKIRYDKLHDMTVRYEAGKLNFTPSCPLDLLKEQKKYILYPKTEPKKPSWKIITTEEILKDMESLSDNELLKWIYQERKAIDTFKYLDLSREYTENQKFVNEQLSKAIREDMADVRDSLAVFTGRAYVKDGIVTYKE